MPKYCEVYYRVYKLYSIRNANRQGYRLLYET